MLSFLRLGMVPVFLYLAINGHDAWALLVLVLASVSDWLDGLLARKLNQITRLGQLLDPAADRLYIFATLLALAWREITPWWFVAIVIARDVALAIAGIVLANIGYGPLPVHHLGKAATLCLFYALPMIMLGQAFPVIAPYSAPVAWAFALWGAFLYWWAGIIYWQETFRLAWEQRVSLKAQN